MDEYDFELPRAVKEVLSAKAKTVCIQLPDGLKPRAAHIASFIEKETGARVLIWAGSCFGSCDVPNVKADLLVQWGHSRWGKLF